MMSKFKTAFFCQSCVYESTKWAGKCPGCQQWNTFVEELIQKDTKKSNIQDWESYNGTGNSKKTFALNEVETKDSPRLVTIDTE